MTHGTNKPVQITVSRTARLLGAYVAILIAFGMGLLVGTKLETSIAAALGLVLVFGGATYLSVFFAAAWIGGHRSHSASTR